MTGLELLQPFVSVRRGLDSVTIAAEVLRHHVTGHGLVVHDEDVERSGGQGAAARSYRLGGRLRGEAQGHPRAGPDRAVEIEGAAVALHSAVDHGETKPRAALALGREERFEAALTGLLGHADARIADFQRDPLRLTAGTVAARLRRGTGAEGLDRDGASLRHGVQRIEDQVRQHLAQLRYAAEH